jgi:hypothetical protein
MEANNAAVSAPKRKRIKLSIDNIIAVIEIAAEILEKLFRLTDIQKIII